MQESVQVLATTRTNVIAAHDAMNAFLVRCRPSVALSSVEHFNIVSSPNCYFLPLLHSSFVLSTLFFRLCVFKYIFKIHLNMSRSQAENAAHADLAGTEELATAQQLLHNAEQLLAA